MTTETHWRESGSSPPLDDYARTLPVADLPDFLSALAKAQALATLRLHTPTVAAVEPEPDVLLTAEQCASRIGLTVEQVKRKRLPFRKKIGERTVRYSLHGLEKWLKRA